MRALHITGHSEICNKSPPSFADPNATSPYRAERGKGRLWGAPANPYCFTNFECKADLSQPFKGNCSQIRSSVTGGAYNSVCRVTMCVRRDLSIGACLNCTRSTHQTVTKRPFSPHSFPARRKRMGRRRCVGNGLDGTSPRAMREASYPLSPFPPFQSANATLVCTLVVRPRRNESPRHARSLLSSEPVSSFPKCKRFAGLRFGG